MVGSCISYPNSPFKKDKFVSFRVDETRRNLTSPQRSLKIWVPLHPPDLGIARSQIRFLPSGHIFRDYGKLKYDTPAKNHKGIPCLWECLESPLTRWRTLKLSHAWTCASETWSPAAVAKTWCNITFLKRFPYKVAPWSLLDGIIADSPIKWPKSRVSWG